MKKQNITLYDIVYYRLTGMILVCSSVNYKLYNIRYYELIGRINKNNEFEITNHGVDRNTIPDNILPKKYKPINKNRFWGFSGVVNGLILLEKRSSRPTLEYIMNTYNDQNKIDEIINKNK